MHELLGLSLIDLRERLRSRAASPVELCEAVFERIDATADTLNSVVAERDRDAVRAEAREAEARIARGEARELEGIPLGVKDLENVAGLRTTHGSWLFRDNVAARDDVHVARLRAAGAIPMAKTNAPEFGPTAITKNLLHGVTRSPWNLEHTPGGSSGGSAAALSGGVLPLVTASDGGGSIRIPSCWTGSFGLKPSHGRVPIGPSERWDSGQMGVYGPLTRTVEDAALVLDVTCGPSPHDPVALPHPGYAYQDVLRAESPRGLRIGYSPDFGRVLVQSDVAEAVEEGVLSLEKLGHRVERVAGGPPSLGEAWLAQAGFGLAGRIGELLAGNEDRIARYLLGLIRQAGEMTPARAADIAATRARVRDWCTSVFERFDLLVTPTAPYDPPPAKGPFPLETNGLPQAPDAAGSFTMPFNTNWNPAANVRVGLSRARLPIGMQIAGPHHRDDLVLAVSRAFERERPWHPEWPTV
jgi:aspartyl-tRNA(Asn)/glutamyl-tRNA(Gln) amidotransferase subunit A